MAVQDIGLVLSKLTADTVNFVPNIVGAIILLVIGLVLGKVIGRVVYEVLDRLKLDFYITETKKPLVSVEALFSSISRWWIYLAFITAAVSVMQVAELTQWMREILGFVPKIIGASIILVVGYVMAEYIRGHIGSPGKAYALLTGKVLFFFVMYVAIALALPILGVSATLVNNILLVIIGSVGLGIAIALGLGLKDAVGDLSRRWVKKVKV